AARRAEVLLFEQLLDLLALDNAGRGIERELGDQHASDAPLQGIEILLALAVRAPVVERHHGDTRAGVPPRLRPQPARCERQQRRAHHCEFETRTHTVSSDQRFSLMPSWAARTSAGRPRPPARACWRAAASSSSIAPSCCTVSLADRASSGTGNTAGSIC